MKALLEFDLNDADERLDHLRAIKATDMSIVLFDLAHNFRKKIEFEIESNHLNSWDTLELVMEKIWTLIEDYNLKEILE